VTYQPAQALCITNFLAVFSLLNWFKLVCGLFGQSNMHHTLDFCLEQISQEKIECTNAKEYQMLQLPVTTMS